MKIFQCRLVNFVCFVLFCVVFFYIKKFHTQLLVGQRVTVSYVLRACVGHSYFSTCIIGIRDVRSDSGDSKELWGLQKGWNPDDRDNGQTGHTEQPAKNISESVVFNFVSFLKQHFKVVKGGRQTINNEVSQNCQ